MFENCCNIFMGIKLKFEAIIDRPGLFAPSRGTQAKKSALDYP